MSKNNPFGELAHLRNKLPVGPSQRQGLVNVSESKSEPKELRELPENRAGRAPYNFVPVPEPKEIAWLEQYYPPLQNIYSHDFRSGHLELELTALTDFYIRGTSLLKADSGKELNEQLQPFEIAGKLRLPGSSLRGMIRGLVEILGYSPLHPINKTRFSYRTIGSSANPNSPDFEPCASRYNELVKGVNAGYLTKQVDEAGREKWFIRPAKRMPGNGKQIYKVESTQVDCRQAVQFDTPRISGDPRQRFLIVPPTYVSANTGSTLPNKGWLVCSGDIEGRRYQWIINEPDDKSQPIEIAPADFEKHREAHLTEWIEEELQQPRYSCDGLPVFYIRSPNDPIEIRFGKTFYFRLPYLYTTQDLKRDSKLGLSDGQVDLATAIFGHKRQSDKRRNLPSGRSGRVFFEDAFEVEGKDLVSTEVTLGQPRPSTFQHYLEQRSESVTKSAHWDSRDGKLRGFKLYWHRSGAVIRNSTGENQEVTTRFLRVGSGARFRARIRYDNLTDVELGALLTAIELPDDCAHHLGMGKPLGLGSFRITAKLTQVCRDQRYTRFFASAGSTLEQGVIDKPIQNLHEYKIAFSQWIMKHLKLGTATADILNDTLCPPRLLDLRRLLTFRGPFVDRKTEWQNATRYLEFGKIRGYHKRHGTEQTYNEYQLVGWPGPPVKSRRRPLPPPAQVIRGENVPRSERPNFDKL